MGKRTKRTKRTIKVDFENKTAHGNKSIQKIIDVPFSKKRSLGTRATKGTIEFHYQKYANMDKFFNKIHLKNLSLKFFYIDLICINNKITPIYQRDIKLGKKQFSLIVINITTNEGNHANIALINNHNKTIEFFEPHGYRKNKNSGIGNFKGLYSKKVKILKKIFLKLLPDHTFINMVDHKRLTSFQTHIDPDENTGFCITWCILYIHYRCLNPRLLLPKLINYLSNKITEPKLLKYAKFIEETAKK